MQLLTVNKNPTIENAEESKESPARNDNRQAARQDEPLPATLSLSQPVKVIRLSDCLLDDEEAKQVEESRESSEIDLTLFDIDEGSPRCVPSSQ